MFCWAQKVGVNTFAFATTRPHALSEENTLSEPWFANTGTDTDTDTNKVADIEVDMVADMEIDMVDIQFGERVGHGGW